MSRRLPRRQRLEMVLGVITVFAVMAVVGAVAEMLSPEPGIVPSLVLAGFALAWWFTYRAWRRADSS
ncbi:hypothetical protein [Rhodococcus artemisiae]|uniref:Secreted protein with PEP-CTERM sorting signal n=1 Tax=Rhodococcus artemisiae TaxID=714159 RepID=A0ABU7LFD4_9NOCA|nr:hypothetical protein [Rhodococcus artemisiae]MEE2060248.1 hypothetical protein [Rhodococcus artemisiae]